jgi:hypothetical protein
MTPTELYNLWAPEESIWSNWAKPVLFAATRFIGEPDQIMQWKTLDISWAPKTATGTAVVLDLPGPQAIWTSMALGQRGFRPVPLYNGVEGPSAVVDANAIIAALHEAEAPLTDLLTRLPPDAPPAFLLDSNRGGAGARALPGAFDNRWCVFPQDFPSANLLLSRGIETVILSQGQTNAPASDLAHVLLRWQEAGLRMLGCNVNDTVQPAAQRINPPPNFGAIWYAALAMVGLRRNSTGGFGAIIPVPGSGGGGFG